MYFTKEISNLCKKSLFQLENVHYLNCAYMSPLSRSVEEAGIIGMQRKRIPTTLKRIDFFEDSEKIRQLFAKMICVPDPYQISIIPSISYGMAIIAKNTNFQRGQNIVVTSEEFPSNVYTWRRVCQEHGLTLKMVEPDKKLNNYGRQWNEKILEAIDKNTALVTLGHVHWTNGILFNLKEIGQRARECGAAFIIDGAQSVGALPLNVSEIQPDALFCPGYKWLMGPYANGVGYFGSRYLDGIPLEENWLNRYPHKSDSFQDLVVYRDEYRPKAIRYDVGEMSNFILMPMFVRALEQLMEWGIENIQTYCRNLVNDKFINQMGELGFLVAEEDSRASHLVGIRLPENIELEKLRSILDKNKIIVSIRGQSIRLAPNIYNDEDDMNAFVDALRQSRN
ncbi:MAG: aminotransferase class V-fold PLP-dependent enzyme [Iphinoe sp. HA4291-MV1]|jgi:selenocysteine lyase/cysteine desulfurase|nr:aminotransferase class V-fold PLP-dependent enzyme [Iphinoe sp. HA4291-MV1]